MGHGKWRLPGRGRRLQCQMSGPGPAIWYKLSHYRAKPCRWCGKSFTHGAEMEIGVIERVRFIDDSDGEA